MTKFKANQCGQPWQQRRKNNVETAGVEVLTNKSDQAGLKTADSIALNHSIKPCPFTFLTAVKRKLELGRNHSTTKKAYDSEESREVPEGTMNFIKPLKVPDLKISPKADFSSRESLLSNEELSKKIEAAQRDGMSSKVTERVPRKLEFSSSSSTSLLNYEKIEPLQVPDLTISKKKDVSRDNSREKENRTKRVKKDDPQDVLKWPESQRHISRKEIAESIVNRKLKNDRILSHGPKVSDAFSKPKSKPKSFITSTSRKDDEKRYKLTKVPLTKSKSKTLESRTSTSSSESLYPVEKGTRLHDKILIREGYKAMLSEITDRKHKEDSQMVNTSKQSEEQKHKSHSEARPLKHQSKSSPIKTIDTLTRDQSKRILDKQKLMKADSKHSSEISEDLTSTASLSKSQNFATETSSSSTLKSKDVVERSHSGSNRNNENYQYSDDVLTASDLISNNSIIETKISQDSSLSEKLLDPLRISFRDTSYSNQAEFADLITPDMNLTIRSSKRRKAPIGRENDSDEKDSKQSSLKNSQDSEQSLMGTQRQSALLDSFTGSLQQTLDTDRSRLSSDDSKRLTASLSNDKKDNESKKNEITSMEINSDAKKIIQKPAVKVAEVQTQTANDIATQTDTMFHQHKTDNSLVCSRVVTNKNDIFGVSLDESRCDGAVDRIENISMPNRMRTTSEISMYETTSSIKTETGTEISISTRDVTCSFNKYLDLEMAQLIKDERQRYDKIEMLFKSREKTLNDRTKKLIKLEEQKRALRDTGQDSRISSVKKKQRALLLKLQQEKDEMNRLKELHKIASQERKLLLQKQRDMFNPEMSTRTILNKLKRSADSQSPRRLSGPMKGYDIRSNSSISSLVDSDKSQLDRSQFDFKMNLSDISPENNDQACSRLEAESVLRQGIHSSENTIDKKSFKADSVKQQKDIAAAVKLKYDLKARKFEEKMPKADKMKQYDLDLVLRHNVNVSQDDDDKSISEHIKSESDAIIEEFAQVLKSQFPNIDSESLTVLEAPETIEAFKKMQRISSSSSKIEKEPARKLQQQQQHQYALSDKNAKRKGLKNQKSKSSQSESISKSEDSNCTDDIYQHLNKRSKIDSDQLSDDNYQNSMLEELDFNESQSSLHALLKHSTLLKERNRQILQDINDERNNAVAENSESPLSQKDEEENVLLGNTSARSQLSLTISHQSSNDSDRSYSRSVVIRSQQDHHHHHTTGLKNSKKLEQILKAREATLVSRRNCVEEWIAWHARLREEENRVARMEQAAYKLVSATAKALSHNDTTVSSDTSDVEGRIELLTQELADRRLEMARLKKEARKKVKQRLRAVEANLLNQIKKYDGTIRDMRKKLDSRKVSSKEIERLAGDPKSVIDFKVPEIPIKKIQEIYKNSDLLRSKSDSDVISARNYDRPKADSTSTNDVDRDSSKSKSPGEPSSVASLYTVNDELENELSEKSDASAVQSYKTKSNSEEIATQNSVITEREVHEMKRSSSQSSNISEEIPSESYSVRSQSGHVQTPKISEAVSPPGVLEHSAGTVSKRYPMEGSNIEEELSPDYDDTSLIFSKKLDHIQLHNKELNDDIHNLESDLKALTEMMSSFGKKTNDNRSDSIDQSHRLSKDTDKSTSKDVSEELPVSESNLKMNTIDDDLHARVKKILSDVVPETDDLVTSIEELDVRAQTVETPNKITTTEEISTHVASPSIENEKVFDTQTDTIISEIIVTAVKEDQDKISPDESRHLVHMSSKSSDEFISAQKDDTYRSDSEKFTSYHIQDNNSDESELTRGVVSSEQIVALKIDDKNTAENEIHTAVEDKSIETGISTTEKVSPMEIVISKTDNEVVSTDCIQTDDADVCVEEIKPSAAKEISINHITSKADDKENIDNGAHSASEDEDNQDKVSTVEEVNLETDDSLNKTAESDDWVSSDSFDIQNFGNKDSKAVDLQPERSTISKMNKSECQNGLSDMEDSALFIPRGESTNIQDTFVLKLDETTEDIGIRSKEFNDILDIIEKTEINEDPNAVLPAPAILELESQNLQKADEIGESPIEHEISIINKSADDVSESIEEDIEGKNDASNSEGLEKDQSPVDDYLPKIEIGIEIQLVDDEEEKSKEKLKLSSPLEQNEVQMTTSAKEVETEDRGSSDGEQLDNLVEVAETTNDTIEKRSFDEEKSAGTEVKNVSTETSKNHVTVVLNRTFEVIKDPEYEDISEESLEVSEILDKSERARRKPKKFSKVPEKYVIKSKSDEVLRILDELSNKSTVSFKEQNKDVGVGDNDKSDDSKTVGVEVSPEKTVVASPEKSPSEVRTKSRPKVNSPEEIAEDEAKGPKIPGDGEETYLPKDVPKNAAESSLSDGMDTPSGISEIDMDSPKGANDNSRLDVDILDDDLLSGNSLLVQSPENEAKTEFHTRPMGVSSEKDIKAMIHKLQASLEQPGIEYAALEAKLLQIENLKIELEIKKLEAEEVSYYFREIPNKPPPPYTPPGAGRLSTSFNDSPSPPPSVVPASAEELTVITDRIAAFIYEAKQSGEHLPLLEAPSEICELSKDEQGANDSNEPLKRDRRIYNTFLFDLCKELVVDLYQSEYEESKPSWMQITVKSGPSLKVPRSLEELNEYVSKEVATLLGFKSKPQRENLVMRWSRKRRDRVDELLAKEAQQEEKEWTTYDYDGLTIKNELTAAVLDNLITETSRFVKAAYAKKRRLAEVTDICSAQVQAAR
ncbi:centrosome-associated protein 350-like isoform X1 [Copidosoma floridanum]|uniref:centrosome-associated protein 350-like isoform X1 n=1 Tax=Copidosoma floridanum TaxID=29053 RepID=UPI0006C9598D|nr:centrosome-associated protein 350-like isoform X1 [Copidosoma floridanum]